MSAWPTIVFGIAGIAISAAVNILVVGIYIGKYKQELADALRTGEETRKDLVKAREDIARIKGRINGHGWRQEA